MLHNQPTNPFQDYSFTVISWADTAPRWSRTAPGGTPSRNSDKPPETLLRWMFPRTFSTLISRVKFLRHKYMHVRAALCLLFQIYFSFCYSFSPDSPNIQGIVGHATAAECTETSMTVDQMLSRKVSIAPWWLSVRPGRILFDMQQCCLWGGHKLKKKHFRNWLHFGSQNCYWD